MPPELEKELAQEVELLIDDWIEQKHAHEVVDLCPDCDKPLNSEYYQGKSCVPAMNEDEFDR